MAIIGPFVAPLPTPTGSPSDDYANKINAAIQEIRDALEGGASEDDITFLTSLNVDGVRVENAAYYKANSSASAPADTGCLYLKSGDWYAKDTSGNEVRLTSGGQLADTNTIYGDQQRYLSLKEVTALTGTLSGNGYSTINISSAGANILFPVPFRVGERIKGARVRTNKAGVGTMTVQFYSSTDGGALTTAGSSQTSAASGLHTVTLTLASPVTTTVNALYFLQINCPAASDLVYSITYTADKIA